MRPVVKFPEKYKEILKAVYSFSKKRKVKLFLVGGILRDIFLGRERQNPDFDFCLKKGAINFARQLKDRMKAGFVVLDKEHGACRLVKKSGGRVYTFDFTDFRGDTLEKDLLHRDFTINAIALGLDQVFGKDDLNELVIDPLKGREDLKRRIIKAANKNSFSEDPLRILRVFSFACMLDFEIQDKTLKLARSGKKKIAGVSYERIRDELFKVFDSPCAFRYLSWMDRLGILKVIFPEIKTMRGIGQGPYHHLDVWQHTLESIRQFEELVNELKNNHNIGDYLEEELSAGRRRLALIKLGLFLHDIGKPLAIRHRDGKTTFHAHERLGLPLTEKLSRRLRLSNDEISSLKTMVLWHLRPGYLGDIEEVTPRAKFRYFRDSAEEAISILLLSVADQRATKGPFSTRKSRLQHEKIAFGLIKECFRRKKEKKTARLVTGDDLKQEFKLEPSPLIGKILSELEELQAIGRIKTRADALSQAARFIKRNGQ